MPTLKRPNFSHLLFRQVAKTRSKVVSLKTTMPKTRRQPGSVIFWEDIVEFRDALEDEDLNANDMYRDWLSWISQVYKDRLKDNILDQKFIDRWPELSEEYLEKKAKAGLDTRMWIRSGQLIDAIQVRFFPQIESWAIGIDENARFHEVEFIRGPDGDIIDWRMGDRTEKRIARIARVLEFGTMSGRIPARPLFRPTIRNIGKNIRDHLEEYVNLRDLTWVEE